MQFVHNIKCTKYNVCFLDLKENNLLNDVQDDTVDDEEKINLNEAKDLIKPNDAVKDRQKSNKKKGGQTLNENKNERRWKKKKNGRRSNPEKEAQKLKRKKLKEEKRKIKNEKRRKAKRAKKRAKKKISGFANRYGNLKKKSNFNMAIKSRHYDQIARLHPCYHDGHGDYASDNIANYDILSKLKSKSTVAKLLYEFIATFIFVPADLGEVVGKLKLKKDKSKRSKPS